MRHKYCTDPVMNNAAGHWNGLSVVERVEPLDHDLTVTELLVGRRTASVRQSFDPQIRPTLGQLGVYLRLRQLNITIVSLRRLQLHVRRVRQTRQREKQGYQNRDRFCHPADWFCHHLSPIPDARSAPWRSASGLPHEKHARRHQLQGFSLRSWSEIVLSAERCEVPS